MRRARAFTLLEILVVVAIIAILASFILSVARTATVRAKGTADVSNMRQLYTAITLYESDNSGKSPDSLGEFARGPYAAVLRSPLDQGPWTRAADFPADLYVTWSERRSPVRISYPYLKSFEEWWTTKNWTALALTGVTWEQMRQTPDIGMLASTWCLAPRNGDTTPIPETGPQPGAGTLLRIQMDGSLRTIPVPERAQGETSLEFFFLNSLRGAPFVH